MKEGGKIIEIMIYGRSIVHNKHSLDVGFLVKEQKAAIQKLQTEVLN
jgi:hypothetical protein